jgi:hypothetical protein
VAIQRRSYLAKVLGTHSAPVRELVVSIPAPGCDHRELQHPALADQFLISDRIVAAYLIGRMGDVELDWPSAARLEVYE